MKHPLHAVFMQFFVASRRLFSMRGTVHIFRGALMPHTHASRPNKRLKRLVTIHRYKCSVANYASVVVRSRIWKGIASHGERNRLGYNKLANISFSTISTAPSVSTLTIILTLSILSTILPLPTLSTTLLSTTLLNISSLN